MVRIPFVTRWPLRVTSSEIAGLVESLRPRCTHYDALRFFTPPARPLNKYQPRVKQHLFEQPGCLHTNMDLYKWAFKLVPFTPSDLVADCFELASRIRALECERVLTIQRRWNSPVCIETPEGRTEYEGLQRDFARMASPLRKRLQAFAKASSRAGHFEAKARFSSVCRPMIVPADVRCWAEIDLSAIRHNAGVVREKSV